MAMADGVPALSPATCYQDKSVFMVQGTSVKRLQEQLRVQIDKEIDIKSSIVFPDKETNTMVLLNKETPGDHHFLVYDLLRSDYTRKVGKKSQNDNAFTTDQNGTLLIRVEGDTIYFDMIKMPNSAVLTDILKPRY